MIIMVNHFILYFHMPFQTVQRNLKSTGNESDMSMENKAQQLPYRKHFFIQRKQLFNITTNISHDPMHFYYFRFVTWLKIYDNYR